MFTILRDLMKGKLLVAGERKVNIITPRIGEVVISGAAQHPSSIWWR